MKLKSYMRGLGIGIVVTALIMGIATKDGRPMTDAEIKAAAAKLGMVDSSSLRLTDLNQDGKKPEGSGAALKPEPEADSTPEAGLTQEPASGPTSPPETELTPKADSTPEAGPTQEPTSEPTSTSTSPPEAESIPEVDSTPEAGPTQEPTSEQTPASASEESPETDTVKITVRSGTGSRAVCNQLADAGLIEDAAAFDQYLIDSGYSKRISSGTFEIPLGASLEEIAKIISKSQ